MNGNFEQISAHESPKKNMIARIVVAIIILGIIAFFVWRFWFTEQTGEMPSSASGIDTDTVAEDLTSNQPEGFGAELFRETQGALAEQLPETNPVTNPLEGIYTNPFE